MCLQVFSGTANLPLARRIAKALEMELGDADIARFPDSEIFVKYNENIRGSDVFVIQSTCAPPAENLVELLIMLDAARRASAARVTAVIPYFGFARQDRKDQPRVPITAKLVANLLVTSGADRVLTVDLHSQQIQGFFDIPVDHLYTAPVMVRYLRKALEDRPVVVTPDVGGVKMAHGYASALEADLAIVAKRRISAQEVMGLHLVGDVDGRDCVLVDDIVSTGGTLVTAAGKLKDAGARRVFAAVSHCCLTDKGYARLQDSDIEEFVTTDTVPTSAEKNGTNVRVLTVAELLAEAVRRIHEDRSVSSLFRHE